MPQWLGDDLDELLERSEREECVNDAFLIAIAVWIAFGVIIIAVIAAQGV